MSHDTCVASARLVCDPFGPYIGSPTLVRAFFPTDGREQPRITWKVAGTLSSMLPFCQAQAQTQETVWANARPQSGMRYNQLRRWSFAWEEQSVWHWNGEANSRHALTRSAKIWRRSVRHPHVNCSCSRDGATRICKEFCRSNRWVWAGGSSGGREHAAI